MTTGNYNIVKLTEVLYRAMEGISENIFLYQRPKVHSKMKDFIVVDFPNRVYNNLGNGQTNCVIELYARDKANGPNTALLSTLQERINERLPINDDKCNIYHPVYHNIGSDNLGFHCIMIYCKVLIK